MEADFIEGLGFHFFMSMSKQISKRDRCRKTFYSNSFAPDLLLIVQLRYYVRLIILNGM